MVTYKLESKRTDDVFETYRKVLENSEKDCVLLINDYCFIERYVNSEFVFYVHIREGRTIEKICVYKKVEEE